MAGVDVLRRLGSRVPTSLVRPRAATLAGASGQKQRPVTRRNLAWTTGLGAFAGMGAFMGQQSRAVAASVTPDKLLEEYTFPAEFPYRPEDFARFDESDDAGFYQFPRFVTHIDDDAIKALTKFYDQNLPRGQDVAVLDLCSSWISHLPKGYEKEVGRVSAIGMNEEELKANPALSDFNCQDLNKDPTLPYEDASFDAILNTVSVDYMTQPLPLFKEMQRVLKPGGQAIMSFSNRCFPTKAVAVWTATGDMDHILIVGSYFHYAGGFERPRAEEITISKPIFGKGDPMYVVHSKKLA